MSIFGPIISSSQVEEAVLNLAETWMPTYLWEVQRQLGITVPLQLPRSFQTSYDFLNWGEGQLPALVCIAPNTVGEMERHGDGLVSAIFEVHVGVLVEDTSEANARRVAQLHQAAFDTMLSQRGSLGGFAAETWVVSRDTRLPDETNRTVAYAESVLHVLVDGIFTSDGGPSTPLPPQSDPSLPWPDWQPVRQTVVTFTAE